MLREGIEMTAINPPGRLADAFEIPATYGRAFVVKKGQVLRIHQVDPRGGQVGDCAFFNANDTKEVFHCGQSWALNQMAGTGNARAFKHFWSKPPRENIMLTTLTDTYRNHWGNMGGRCSKRIYEIRSGIHEHRSCQENIAAACAVRIVRRRRHRHLQRLHVGAARRRRQLRDRAQPRDHQRLHRSAGRDGCPRRDLGLPG